MDKFNDINLIEALFNTLELDTIIDYTTNLSNSAESK